MKADFSGWATKSDIVCSDGATIKPGAFKHQDKSTVPLVWMHMHNDPENVLGHSILEERPGGTYVYGFFNNSPKGQIAKTLVEHGDVKALSIFANQLKRRGGDVLHGDIREVSLCIAGANRGALIENVSIQHSDGDIEEVESEAVMYTGLPLEHSDLEESDEDEEDDKKTEDALEHAGKEGAAVAGTATKTDDDKTLQDVYATFDPEQLEVVHYMIGKALEEGASDDTSDTTSAKHSDEDLDAIKHAVQEGIEMGRNVFEQNGSQTDTIKHGGLTIDQITTIFEDAKKGGSFKEAVLAHADDYGINDIDLLFPDAKNLDSSPQFLSRRMEWVNSVLTNTKHSPFSRLKSLVSDITAEEARAKGYVKGNLKKDEIIKMAKRVTGPQTIYKKQKLDRDDILDITDFDVVQWLMGEMRVMLDEELARAILFGDGREADDDDKINEDNIRPIAYEQEMYQTTVTLASGITPSETVDAIVTSLNDYRGSGNPILYTTQSNLTTLLLDKDTLGRRFYATKQELASALGVSDIVAVDPMTEETGLYGIIVNLTDYTVGADAGGAVNMFDDFDIDYNQQKYLIETRVSGALNKPKSAVVIKNNPGTSATPAAPTQDGNTVTITPTTGVTYTATADDGTNVPIVSNAFTLTEANSPVTVEATANSGYTFPHDAEEDWTFAYTA